MMNKMPIIYRVGRFLLSPLFKLYYNPKIYGKENLQIPGSKIIVSNHYHLYDQFNTIISTKEFIKYLAKKEYFDSPLKRFLFSHVGCIPVDRSKKDEYASMEAKNVLNKMSAIGLFPEGTRNKLKLDRLKSIYYEYYFACSFKTFQKKLKYTKTSTLDKLIELKNTNKITYDEFINNIFNIEVYLSSLVKRGIITQDEYLDAMLLDFKYGAVSLAKKTGSYIIPSVITGHYRFRSKDITIRYGTPYKVGDLSLTEENQILRKKIIDLLKENIY